MSEKHIFALHVHELSAGTLTIADQDFAHRVRHVLRLESGDVVQLFTKTHHAQARLVEFKKKDTVVFAVDALVCNVQPTDVTFLLPVLKVGDLSDAIYALAEVGVARIQLVITQKSQHALQSAQFEKLQRVIIAAAEQSKSFAYAQLCAPIPLPEALAGLPKDVHKLYADISGAAAVDWTLPIANARSVVVLVGPEGDLTHQEKEQVRALGFVFVRLTSTVLRAVQAVALLAGMVNCFMQARRN